MIPSFRILTFKNSTYPTVCSRLFSIRWGCQCEIYWSWNNFHKWMCRSRDNLKRNYHKVQVYFVKRSNILLQYLFHVILLLFMVLDLQILITQKKKAKRKDCNNIKTLVPSSFWCPDSNVSPQDRRYWVYNLRFGWRNNGCCHRDLIEESDLTVKIKC